MKPVVILSGPVGAGKSTVANELVALSPVPLAYIEGDKFWFFFAKPSPDVPQHQSFRTIMRAMLASAMHYALGGSEVILDFSLPPWFLETAIKVMKSREVPLDFVVLRPTEAVCAARAAARSEGTIHDYTLYHDLYLDFEEAGQYAVSDDDSDPAALAARIREGLDAGKFRVSP